MKIYLDTCCYNRPLDDQSHLEIQFETIAKLDIQGKVREGVYKLVWSYMLNLENEANPRRTKEKLCKLGKTLLGSIVKLLKKF